MSVQFLGRRGWLKPLGYYIGLFSLCFLFTVACGGGGDQQAATPDGRVAIGTTLSARTLDPADAYDIFPGIMLYNLADRLYTYAPGTTDLEPQLATEMPTVSDDGLTYVIPLRQDEIGRASCRERV